MTGRIEGERLLLALLGVGELERLFVEVWSLSFDDFELIEGVNRSGRVWFAFQLINGIGVFGSGSQVGGVAYAAHIGGFIAGAVLIWMFVPRRVERPR